MRAALVAIALLSNLFLGPFLAPARPAAACATPPSAIRFRFARHLVDCEALRTAMSEGRSSATRTGPTAR